MRNLSASLNYFYMCYYRLLVPDRGMHYVTLKGFFHLQVSLWNTNACVTVHFVRPEGECSLYNKLILESHVISYI
jgi:hypothetical protein